MDDADKVLQVPLIFDCDGDTLHGLLHQPPVPAARGVLIVVGGPQTKVGSHRQFLLLARSLAAAGVPAMRFDYRGMGDSTGDTRDFEQIGADIRAAVDCFFEKSPGLREVVLWGLCDAASAIAFYAHADTRITGAMLLNPWLRTDAGLARATVQHYYVRRLIDPQFWLKVFRGKFALRTASASFSDNWRRMRGAGTAASSSGTPAADALPERMFNGLNRFHGRVLVILSGDDITANEFRDCVRSSRAWRRLLRGANYETRELAEANHTFSRRAWRDQVARWTLEWLRAC